MNLDALMAELERDEGVRFRPYKDSVGKTTIGVGRNLDDVGISNVEARQLLLNDIARTTADLDKALPWWRTLDEVRQRVLVNMAFNMGTGGLVKFRQTLVFVKAGMWGAAADGMMASLWAKQVGPRAARLAAMMRTGQDAGGGVA